MKVYGKLKISRLYQGINITSLNAYFLKFSINRTIFSQTNMKFSEFVNITYMYLSGKKVHVKAPIGENLLITAKNNQIELEGACECSMACATCHLILDKSLYDKLEQPCEDEINLLTLNDKYSETSRLGCQIIASKELEGRVFKIPFDPVN